MSRYITIAQAMAAVRRLEDERCPTFTQIFDALRSIEPAEPTEEEVERVARGIYAAEESVFEWSSLDVDSREYWHDLARAAIAAMRASK